MLPVVALVGRPNVGKSTIYNSLTKSRDAIVSDMPGVTRDRREGEAKLGPLTFRIVDTAGMDTGAEEDLAALGGGQGAPGGEGGVGGGDRDLRLGGARVDGVADGLAGGRVDVGQHRAARRLPRATDIVANHVHQRVSLGLLIVVCLMIVPVAAHVGVRGGVLLVLRPVQLLGPRVHLLHGDALRHRAHQAAQVAAHALVLDDPHAGAPALVAAGADGLVGAVVAGGVAQAAADALLLLHRGDDAVVQVQLFPALDRKSTRLNSSH